MKLLKKRTIKRKKKKNIKQQKKKDLTLLTIKLSKYLRQELDSKVLDLVKQKWFYPFEYVSGLRKSCQAKESQIKNVANKADVRLVNKKKYLKWTSKPGFMSQKNI